MEAYYAIGVLVFIASTMLSFYAGRMSVIVYKQKEVWSFFPVLPNIGFRFKSQVQGISSIEESVKFAQQLCGGIAVVDHVEIGVEKENRERDAIITLSPLPDGYAVGLKVLNTSAAALQEPKPLPGTITTPLNG